jgi:ABC-type Fe3+ transport system permease subunit
VALETARLAAPRFRLEARPVLVVGTVALLSFVVLYPILVLIINSFVITRPWEPAQYGLRSWQFALLDRGMLAAMWNTVQLAAVHQVISLPFAILIAWLLGRTNIPWARGLEFSFWLTFFMPVIPTIQAWILLLDPNYGMINKLLRQSSAPPPSISSPSGASSGCTWRPPPSPSKSCSSPPPSPTSMPPWRRRLP